MADGKAGEGRTGTIARLGRTRAITTASIALERMWPLVLPLLIVIALFLSLAWLGGFRLMADWLRLGVLAVFALALLASLYPLRFFRWPRRAEIDRRIERANELDHTPVLVQADRLSSGNDGFAQALWREHQRRMADRLRGLSGDLPRTQVPDRDPWGARAAAALILVTAFAFSYGPLGGTVADAFRAAPGVAPVPPRIDAWVTPPPYTGRAPLFLTAEANRDEALFTVPQGSEVTLRVTGGAGTETLDYQPLNGEAVTIEPNAPKAPADATKPARAGVLQFAGKLNADGTLVLKSGESEIQTWAFSIVPDKPPTIAFLDEPKRAVNGTLELTYTINDDYGAVSGAAEFEPVEAPAVGARPLYEKPDMPLSMPRKTAREGAAKTSRDLTEHVWAGVPVRVRLTATDAAGQAAESETKTLVLPERPSPIRWRAPSSSSAGCWVETPTASRASST